MSQQIFDPQTREAAIQTTCSNLIMAELLEPEAVVEFLEILYRLDDANLALLMMRSRVDYGEYLEHGLSMN